MRLLFVLCVALLGGCSIVTLPVKVATKTVGTAVDVTTSAVDMVIPDGADKEEQ